MTTNGDCRIDPDDRTPTRLPVRRTIRPVRPEEAGEALRILQAAAVWSARFGEQVWQASAFTLRQQEESARRGELIGGYDDGVLSACMVLQDRDALFWPDDPPGEALYVHKVAVGREAAGSGWLDALIEHAEERAVRTGAIFLRLDTLPRERMIGLYVALGFDVVDHDARRFAEGWRVRLEKRLDDAT